MAFKLLRNEGVIGETLNFPTVLALEEGEVVGILSTNIQDDALIIAGPMVLKSDKRRPFTAMRLYELYENAMRNIGITSFLFSTNEGHIFDKVVREKLNLEPYATKDGRNFYIRKLSYGNESQGAGSVSGGNGAAEGPGRTAEVSAETA